MGVTSLQKSIGTTRAEALNVSDMDLNTFASKYVTFSPGTISLSAGVVYWIILEGSYSANATNYIAWSGALQDPYASGKPLSYTTGANSWTTTAVTGGQDQMFRVGCTGGGD
jgi:hypothetical protein